MDSKCSILTCDKSIHAQGLCGKHYMRLRTHGDPNIVLKREPVIKTCKFLGCDRKHYALGYCQKHRFNLYKIKLFDILGGCKCQCDGVDCWHSDPCNVDDKDVIQLDHINNDGYKEREKFNGSAGYYFYYAKHPEEAKKQLKPLCANCNWKKKQRKNHVP